MEKTDGMWWVFLLISLFAVFGCSTDDDDSADNDTDDDAMDDDAADDDAGDDDTGDNDDDDDDDNNDNNDDDNAPGSLLVLETVGRFLTFFSDVENQSIHQSDLAFTDGDLHLEMVHGDRIGMQAVSLVWLPEAAPFALPAVWRDAPQDGTFDLKADAAGYLHAVFFDRERRLIYATNRTGEWVANTVFGDPSAAYYNRPVELEIDAAGNPHILCQGDPQSRLWYVAINAEDMWFREAVESRYTGDYHLAFGHGGKPCAVYVFAKPWQVSRINLAYAERGAKGWKSTVIESGLMTSLYSGYYPSAADLVITPDGTVHVSYTRSEGAGTWIFTTLKYARFQNGKWTKQELGDGIDSWSRIAARADGTLHIFNGSTYFTNEDGTWQTEDLPVESPQNAALTMRSDGSFALAYSDYDQLYLIEKKNGTWQRSNLFSATAVETGWHPSIAVDAAGAAYLAFISSLDYSLWHATNATGNWRLSAIATPVDFAFSKTSLVVDEAGHSTIAFADGYDGGADTIIDNVTGDWRSTVVHTHGFDDTEMDNSLVRDEEGFDHAVFDTMIEGQTGRRLGYATNRSGDWDWEAVPVDAAQAPWFVSLAIDGEGRPAVAYYEEGNEDLWLAIKDGDGWNFEAIDQTGDVGRFVSMARGLDDRLHLAYLDRTNDQLKHAAGVPGDWTIETVNEPGAGGNAVGLALDGDGFAHLAYGDGAGDNLYYATNRSGEWRTTAVDLDGPNGGWPSRRALAIDAAGTVHVAYRAYLALYHVTFPLGYEGGGK